MAAIDEGAWLVYPREGSEPGAGGDAYEVRYFGNSDLSELQALKYVNSNPEYRAVYIATGESISEAEGHRE